jgi:membrane-bound metal-dependent hydrolase YbcI (DUF457 family)
MSPIYVPPEWLDAATRGHRAFTHVIVSNVLMAAAIVLCFIAHAPAVVWAIVLITTAVTLIWGISILSARPEDAAWDLDMAEPHDAEPWCE